MKEQKVNQDTGEIQSTSLASSTSLYQLTEDYMTLMQLASEGENVHEALQQMQGTVIVKFENIGKVVTTLSDSVKSIDAEMERLRQRKDRIEYTIKRLMWGMQESFRETDISNKLQYPVFEIGIEKLPPDVQVVDESKVQPGFIRQPKPPAPAVDKTACKDYWKETGITPPGIIIRDKRYRLVIRDGRSIIAASEGYEDE